MMPRILGILNVTPDSFSDGGQFEGVAAVDHAKRMIEEGADFVDVGGESTRPGSAPVPLEKELRRVMPVIEALTLLGIAVSVDTQKPEVARAALDAGVQVINDVNGLQDPAMFELIVERKPIVCVMHRQGTAATMQSNPQYDDVLGEVTLCLEEMAQKLNSEGVAKEKIWLDPGIGFGKNLIHNLSLLNGIDHLVRLGHPVMLGVSRKRCLGQVTGENDPMDREAATLACHVLAQSKGVQIFRTHDVKNAVRAARMAAAILNPSAATDRLNS